MTSPLVTLTFDNGPTPGVTEPVLDLLAAHKPVVTANKQLVAQHGAELFAAAAAGGVQLRFEASVCAAIATAWPWLPDE